MSDKSAIEHASAERLRLIRAEHEVDRINKHGSRKYKLAMISVILCTVFFSINIILVVTKDIAVFPAALWMSTMGGTLAMYKTANFMEKWQGLKP